MKERQEAAWLNGNRAARRTAAAGCVVCVVARPVACCDQITCSLSHSGSGSEMGRAEWWMATAGSCLAGWTLLQRVSAGPLTTGGPAWVYLNFPQTRGFTGSNFCYSMSKKGFMVCWRHVFHWKYSDRGSAKKILVKLFYYYSCTDLHLYQTKEFRFYFKCRKRQKWLRAKGSSID